MARVTRGMVQVCSAALLAIAPLRLAAQTVGEQTPAGQTPSAATVQPADPPSGGGVPGVVLPMFQPTTVAPVTPRERRGPATTQISFNFEQASVDAVLDHLSQDAGFAILKPDGQLDFRVNITALQPVSPEDAVSLLNAVLKQHGYTAVQMGRTLKIVTIDKAKKGDIPVRFGADPEQVPDTDELVTQVIPVRSIDAVKLKQDLQPLISTDADVTSNGGSNSIIITDTSSAVRRIVEVVASLDKKDALESTIRVKQLKFADATSAATLITTIFKPPDQANQGSNNQPGQGRLPRFPGFGGFGGGGGGGGGAAAPADEKGNTGTVVAAADSRTNTVVVTGPPDTLKVIDEMLNQLDADPAEQQTFFLYPVKNGQAVDMASTLNSLFGGTGSTGGTRSSSTSSTSNSFGSSGFGGGFGSNTSSGRGGSASAFGGSGGGTSSGFGGGSNAFSSNSTGSNNSARTGGGSSSFGGGAAGSSANSAVASLIGQVLVVADADTNSLLIATASKFQDRVKAIVEQLDRPVGQVLLKCLIAEVTHDNSDDLGLDFSVLNTRANGKGSLLDSSLGNGTSNATNGGLAVAVVENNVSATLHALATVDKVDVLSRPYILASDNQQASVMVGQVVPYISESRLDENDNTINTVTYQNIGIILTVIPHINPEGLVTMQVEPQISDESPTNVQISNGVFSPVFDQRIAETYVAVQDGQTIVIGGLMQDEKQSTVTKVPILGSLPFIGAAFQRNAVTKTKTELLIFLTPHVAKQATLLKGMAEDEMKGLKLTPAAVSPGIFDENIRGMQRGATQPTNESTFETVGPAPATPPALKGP